jgi:hypothetical protein
MVLVLLLRDCPLLLPHPANTSAALSRSEKECVLIICGGRRVVEFMTSVTLEHTSAVLRSDREWNSSTTPDPLLKKTFPLKGK